MTSAKAGNYSPCVKRPIMFIVVHYTAGKKDSAKGNVNYFANNAVQASAHYFCDANGWEQSVDDNDIAWSVGTAGVYRQRHPECSNYNSISVEMCCESDRYTISERTRRNAAKLVSKLMIRYDIGIDHVLRHWDVVNKKCPAWWVDDETQWTSFRKEVNALTGKAILESINEYLDSVGVPEWAKAELEEAKQAGITDGSSLTKLIPRYQAILLAYRASKK